MTRKAERAIPVAVAVVFAVWAALFIYQSSYIGIDGRRYFGLFDDAMISMRFGWNLAHGSGLVWNPGERVEGYTNLLMTLAMSAASLVFNKSLAVLAIQILGIPTLLGIAVLARRLAEVIGNGSPHRGLIGNLVFASTLLYYPLSYWTLMGMETGLLCLLLLAAALSGLRWLRGPDRGGLLWMALAAGLAFLARNDSLIPSAIIFVYVALASWFRDRDRSRQLSILRAAALFGAIVVAQTAFRYAYYGEVLPNTYVLKLTHYPLNVRLIDGSRFVLGFFGQVWPLFVLSGFAFWRGPRMQSAFLLSLILALIAYQVYVGGDPWDTWRLLAPGIPALFIVAVSGAVTIVRSSPRLRDSRFASTAICLIALAPAVFSILPFMSDVTVRGPTSAAIANRTNTNAAIAINALTLPGASIGVIWAGTLPYYTDRYAIDFLGKSDPHIASLDADVSGSSGWGQQITIPGHNKYDLDYSIVQRKPTYSQAFSWGYATVRPYFVQHYVRVEYHGVIGTKTIFLLKDSPLVCWEACRSQYQIVPWPAQK